MIISKNDLLSDIIISQPNIIPLINRFGILLGTSDKSIEQVCSDYNLDSNFIVTILNTYINDDFFPENDLKIFNAKIIINYISKTYTYYNQYMIPNIERHFNLLIAHSGENNNLHLIKHFFEEIKNDIIKCIEHDNKQWFPLIYKLETNEHTIYHKIQPYNTLSIEEKIKDLKSMLIIHLKGYYDINLCYAVISSIVFFEKDLQQNNRIRNRILSLIYQELINNA